MHTKKIQKIEARFSPQYLKYSLATIDYCYVLQQSFMKGERLKYAGGDISLVHY